MRKVKKNKQKGFSLLELMLAMTIMLVLMAIAATLFRSALGMRSRESRRTDALTSARAAINLMSREIANSGYALNYNGIITADSGEKRLRFRTNLDNTDTMTDDPNEDVMYYYEPATQSIVRYNRFPTSGATSPEISYVVNRISDVTFRYFDYTGSNSTPQPLDGSATPTTNTSRVRITITVRLDPAIGQPDNQTVQFTSDVTLRNSNYMLAQY